MKILSINKALTEEKYPSVVFDTDIEGSKKLISQTKIDDLKLLFSDYKLTIIPNNEYHKVTNRSIDRIIESISSQESIINSDYEELTTKKADYMQSISDDTGYDIV